MVIDLNEAKLGTIEQIREFLEGTADVVFTVPAEVALLAELDSLRDTLSGPATKVLAQRAHTRFGDRRCARLAVISVSHLYNLRARAGYQRQRVVWQKPRPSPIKIGIRKAPAPQGLPGYIRIGTVHQDDRDGAKGVYHINAVDIVTQWELVAAVERISEAFQLPDYVAHLKPGINIEGLDRQAFAMSDNDAAAQLQRARK